MKRREEAKRKAEDIVGKCKGKTSPNKKWKQRDSWLVKSIKKKIRSTARTMKPHRFQFKNSREAAKANTKLLKKYRYDLAEAMEREKGTFMEPGSEFRPVEELQWIYGEHEHWSKIESIISNGVTYHIPELDKKERTEDLEAMISRGNHKSTKEKENVPTLLSNYEKEVHYGWMLPITIENVRKIRGARVIPVGITKQFTVNHKGKRIAKRRTTHDASLLPSSQKSINNTMICELLTE